MDFEWDQNKETENIRKHGISFTEASECFRDHFGLSIFDENHSSAEDRYYFVGKSNSGRIITVRFVSRGDKYRIFGAAEWRKFRELYERTKDEWS